MKSFQELREKAVSQQQQKLMGLALAYKRGEASDDEVSDQVKKMADSMSTKDLEDFAKTKHKDLPKKVDEYGGPPISRKDYLKQKPMEESKDVEKAVQIAKDMGGDMTGAHKKIEKISKGLSKHPKVKNALRMANEMKENIEDRMPASPDEKRMAIKQAEFIQYVGREIVEHLDANKEFPEWMQNKLSALHQKSKDMHATLGAHGEMDESVSEAVPAGMKFIAGYDGIEGKRGVKHTYYRKGNRMTDPVVVYINGKEWKEFGSMRKAKSDTIDHIKKNMKESVEEDSGEGKSFWNLRERRRNARSDASSAMQDDPDMKQRFSKDVSATDDDRKAADKNIIVQLRRVSDLPKGGEVEFKNGKKTKVSQKDAKKLLKGFDGLRKGPDKERFQKMAGQDPSGLKRVMNLVK